MSVVGTDRTMSSAGLGRTLRTLRDPLLLFAVPVTFALLLAFVGYGNSWPIGFDFRGTLWEPARALLDGTPIYPEPTREAVSVGNPAVYPPVFILASVPLALVAGDGCRLALARRPRRPRCSPRCGSSRCATGAASCSPSPPRSSCMASGTGTSPCSSSLPLALAWRYRDRARGRRHRGGCGSRREAVRLAARRLAALDAALPRRRVGRRLGSRDRARRVGAGRIPGAARLPDAAPRRAGRVRGAEPVALHRRRCARRLGARSRRGRRGRRARVPRARGVARPATGRRPPRLRDRRRGVHPGLADRLAQLRRPSARPDRDHLAAASARRGSSGTRSGSPAPSLRITSRCASRLRPAASSNRRGSGATRRRRGGSPRRCAWSWALSA